MAFSAEDIVPDSPTNNFATLNAIYEGDGGGSGTLSEGNLKWATTSGHRRAVANIAHGSKFYVEYVCNANGGPNNVHSLGFVQISDPTGTVNRVDLYFNNYTNGSHSNIVNGSSTVVVTPAEYVYTGDVIGLCFDPETGYGWYSINGSWKQNGNPSTGTNPVFSNISSNNWTVYNWNANNTGTYNFGQDPTFAGSKNTPATVNGVTGPFAPSGDAAGTAGLFYYPPPTGALALCTANLPDFTPTVIDDTPQDYFKAVTYTGNGTGQSITSVGFQPDLVWAKSRSSATSHALADSVRGPRKILSSNSTADEYSETSGKTLLSFDSDGFTVGTDGNYTAFTANNSSIVAWCWKAGGAPDLTTPKPFAKNGVQYETLSAANITAGTITPTAMSVNTDAGFSIVKYPGASASNSKLPHGLTQAPEMIIIKNLDFGNGWVVGNDYLTNWGYALGLDLTNGQYTASVSFDSTAPTNSVITLGNSSGANNSSYNYIAYCWHSVEGYSKFGSYTGNGSSTDGPFVYCGFRPSFVMAKRTDVSTSNTSWIIFDNARDPNNEMNSTLYANRSAAEGYRGDGTTVNPDIAIDFLSNGIKIRTNRDELVGNVIYMAFAEQPFKFSNAR